MGKNNDERIENLRASLIPVAPSDTMAEAGRKVLLAEFIRVLEHEAGSRTGADIEDVHQMRVATRRMRSALRLLRPYFKTKAVRPFNRELRRIAWALGAVRDLDVMIEHLRQFQAGLDADQQANIQAVLDELDKRRDVVRLELIETLDSKAYRRFVSEFSQFLTTSGAGVRALAPADGEVLPYQVRHVLPTLIYDRLGAVRAYDTVLPEADVPTMHALRIEFKRLRYLLSLFDDVLGPQAKEYVDEIKAIQDHLGHLNDVSVAHARLDTLLDELRFPDALASYFASLEQDSVNLKTHFQEVWERFNTRRVQQKLASSVLSLR